MLQKQNEVAALLLDTPFFAFSVEGNARNVEPFGGFEIFSSLGLSYENIVLFKP